MENIPRHWQLALIAIGVAILNSPALACALRNQDDIPTVTIPLKYEHRRSNASYHVSLLALALKKSESEYGPCEAKIAELYLPSTRLHLYSVEKGLVDIVDTTTSPERDKRLTPVRIPLLKGLMGYRVFFIRRGEQFRFSTINRLEEFTQFSFGLGSDWPDNKILQANGFRVVTAPSHASLMRMLAANRFDIYSRGAQQILVEQQHLHDHRYSVEQSVGLAYISPAYFHVSLNNPELAERLRIGLENAIADGSFDELFYSHPLIKNAFSGLNLQERRFFYLCNPNLHPETPLDKPEYWWRPWPENIICKRP